MPLRHSPLRFLTPVVRDKRELRVYVVSVVGGCVAAALVADSINQYFTASSIADGLQALSVTFLLATSIASIAAWIAGRALLELFRAKAEVDILSRTDPLTGLPNRRAFLAAADALPIEAIVLLIADIDRFKRINDTRGHLAGDEVLRTVARQMADQLGDLGHLGRVGGEEFALIVSGHAVDEVVARVDRFRERLADTPVVCRGERVSVTVSVGVAVGSPFATFEHIYAEADQALYAAKRAGRNTLRIARSQHDRATDRDLLNWRDDTVRDSGGKQRKAI